MLSINDLSDVTQIREITQPNRPTCQVGLLFIYVVLVGLCARIIVTEFGV
jgi:hypothetical protein